MRRFVPLLCLVILAVPACDRAPERVLAPDLESALLAEAPEIAVMTRNLYLGADIDLLLDPSVPLDQGLAQALAQLSHTDYVSRAFHLAAEIAAHRPHVVGLQEVTHYILETVAGQQQIHFLDILRQYLALMGQPYDVAHYQTNVALSFPVGFGGILAVTYIDGDAILVRPGVAWRDATGGHFDSQVLLSVGPFTFPNLRGWNAVTVDAPGLTFRFVNTHLEIQRFAEHQEAQARELVALAGEETLPVVMVGDFNSAANPTAPSASRTATYHILRKAGFADLWLRQPHSVGGLTCCHAADLSNEESTLNQRLDLILARFGPAGFGGQAELEVVGDDPADRFSVGDYSLWPSDHAGVVGVLRPAVGLVR